jgi:hypothetical protein
MMRKRPARPRTQRNPSRQQRELYGPEAAKAWVEQLVRHREALLPELCSKATELEALLLQYDVAHTVANISFKQLSPVLQGKNKTHQGLDAVVEYVSLLYLKHDEMPGRKPPPDAAALQHINDLAEEIVTKTTLLHIMMSADPRRTGPPPAIEGARFRTITQGFYERGAAYPHHQEQLLRRLFSPFDAELVGRAGFDTESALKIVNAITPVMERQVKARFKQTLATIKSASTALKQYRHKQKPTDEQWIPLCEQLNEMGTRQALREVEQRLTAWLFLFLGDAYSLDAGTIAQEAAVPPEKVLAFLARFSTECSSVPSTFWRPEPDHLLKLKPLVKLGEVYLCPNPRLLLWSVKAQLEAVLTSNEAPPRLVSRYARARAAFLEGEVLALLQQALQPSIAQQGLKYKYGGEGCELDGLLLHDCNLFLIEAKSGSITAAAKRGGVLRLERHLEELLGDSHAQVERARKYVLESERPEFTTPSGSSIVLDRGKIRNIFTVTPTLEPLNIFTACLTDTARTGIFMQGPLAWAVSIADLRVITEVIEFPSQLIHYLLRRTRMNELGWIQSLDELDLFGYYLKRGLYFEDVVEGHPHQLFVTGSTDEIDRYYEQLGHSSKKQPRKPRQIMPKTLRTMLEDLEKWRAAGYSAISCALLDMDARTRRQLSKYMDGARSRARERNGIADGSLILARAGIGVTCLAAPAEEAEKGWLRLKRYCELKKYQTHLRVWIGLLSVLDRRGIVHGGGMMEGLFERTDGMDEVIREMEKGGMLRPYTPLKG